MIVDLGDHGVSLSIGEAAKLVGKSQITVRRWKRLHGGDILASRESLLDFSKLRDQRAVGKSFELRLHRDRRATGATPATKQAAPSIRSYFPDTIDQDEPFYELPIPCRRESADRALELLDEIREAFSQRVGAITESCG